MGTMCKKLCGCCSIHYYNKSNLLRLSGEKQCCSDMSDPGGVVSEAGVGAGLMECNEFRLAAELTETLTQRLD